MPPLNDLEHQKDGAELEIQGPGVSRGLSGVVRSSQGNNPEEGPRRLAGRVPLKGPSDARDARWVRQLEGEGRVTARWPCLVEGPEM